MLNVSVVIPLYNKEQTIERAIRSVLNQTVQDFEIVVVDDGSTDNGPRVVEAIGNAYIRLVHQENRGVSAARNRGVAESKTDLIAFLDADDEWRPAFLETVRRLSHVFPEAVVFATGYLFCEDGGRSRAPIIRGIPGPCWEGILDNYFAVAAKSDPPLWSSSLAVRKEALHAVGGFPLGVTSGEDLLTWARLAVAYPIAYSAQSLSLYHIAEGCTPSMLSRRPDEQDVVNTELRRLQSCVEPSRCREFRRYVGQWNKMRASVFLQHGLTLSALRESCRAVLYRPTDWRLYFYVLLACLPPPLCQRVFPWLVRRTEMHRLQHAPER